MLQTRFRGERCQFLARTNTHRKLATSLYDVDARDEELVRKAPFRLLLPFLFSLSCSLPSLDNVAIPNQRAEMMRTNSVASTRKQLRKPSGHLNPFWKTTAIHITIPNASEGLVARQSVVAVPFRRMDNLFKMSAHLLPTRADEGSRTVIYSEAVQRRVRRK